MSDAADSRRPVRRWLLVVFALCLVFGAAHFAHVSWSYREAHRLDAFVNQIRAKGDPLPWYSWQAAPRAPDFETPPDAFRYYLAAAHLMRGPVTPLARAFRQPSGPSPEQRALAGRALELNKASLDIARQAASLKGEPVWPYDSSLGRQIMSLGELHELVVLHTLKSAFDGRTEDAILGLLDEMRILRTLESTPNPIAIRFKGLGLLDVAMDVQTVLERTGPTDGHLARLQAELSAADDPELLERAYVVERAEVFRQVSPEVTGRRMRGMRWPWALSFGFFESLARPLLQRRTLEYLRVMTSLVEAARRPAGEVLGAIDALEQADRDGQSLLGSPWEKPEVLTRAKSTARVHLSQLAVSRAAAVAVAIERFRHVHRGSLPASLDELVPTFTDRLPIDPVTGQAFRYLTEQSGYVVYSVGADGQDDRGTLQKPPPYPPDGRWSSDRSPDWGVRIRLSLSGEQARPQAPRVGR